MRVESGQVPSRRALVPLGWLDAVPSLVWTLVGIVAGSGAAFVAVRVGTEGSPFARTTGYGFWVALVVAQGASWTVVLRAGLDAMRLVPSPRHRRVEFVVTVAVAALLTVLATAATYRFSPATVAPSLPRQHLRIGFLYAAAVFAVSPALLAMWRLFRRLDRPVSADDVADSDAAERLLHRFVEWRRMLRTALVVAGVLVTLGTLSTGQLRNARIAVEPGLKDAWPAQTVLLTGAAYTLALLANYLPAQRRLDERARELVDALVPLRPSLEDISWTERIEARNRIGGLLGTTASTRETVNSAVLIAGPLLTSTLALLLGQS